jgi:cytochrome c oxidase subunit II
VDRSEKMAIWIASLLMVSFSAALVYAFVGLNIRFPGCVTDKTPFTKGKVIQRGVGEYEVQLVAKMWAFEPSEIEIPVGSKVDLYLSSLDVNHGFQIKFTNVNLMAVPGTVNYAQVTFDKPGDYPLICHEYCGAGHQNMMGKIRVKAREDSLSGAVPQSDVGIEQAKTHEAPTLNESDLALLAAKGCTACHSLDGTRMVGPSLKGIFGGEEELEDGSKLTVNEDYIRESIKNPMAKIVKGYPKVMVAMPMTDQELEKLIEIVKGIR